jgi:hypothetical protein
MDCVMGNVKVVFHDTEDNVGGVVRLRGDGIS